MIIKQKQWRKAGKQSTYRDSGVMEALKRLYGPPNSAGCVLCGHDSLDDLGIHKVNDRPVYKCCAISAMA